MLYPISERENKVSVDDFGNPEAPLPECLPNILAGKDFQEFVKILKEAIRNHEDIVIMMGGHVIKCGCSPFIIEMMRRKCIAHIAMNGGAMIHDYEIGMFGGTSESVEENLPAGKFGMWEESYDIIKLMNERDEALSLGGLVASQIEEQGEYRLSSILGESHRLGIDASVFSAMGADFIHDPDMELSLFFGGMEIDLKFFNAAIQTLSPSAVVINFGSAVILPEIWLKCLSRGVNAGHDYSGITCANFDMNRPYRAIEQIVKRPRLLGATTFNFIGQHEILIPLLVKTCLM